MTNREAPLQSVEEALERGFRVEDVRSNEAGVTVELRRDDVQEAIHFSPAEARRIVEDAPAPRQPAP